MNTINTARKPRTDDRLARLDAYVNRRFWAAITRGDTIRASFWRRIKSRIYAERTTRMH